ncbi:MAG TPA: TlpA disulfide reductase family protein [Acidimicrobiia bacterium]|nr:TlpA disulfide reductase family protein [Acidimicrobiia bacterium]
MIKRWVIFSGAGLVVAVLAVVFASRFGSDPTLSPSPLIDTKVPNAVITPIDGSAAFSLTDLEGSIVLVNFWAPWCVPCREEHAVLLDTAVTYASSGVLVVGIAYQSELADVNVFLDELGRGYPTGMDDRSAAAIAFGVRGVPETFFVDRAGTIVGKVSGPVDAALVAATLESIILGVAPGA